MTILFCWLLPSYSQNESIYTSTIYTEKNGFYASAVSGMIQDDNGFIWIGTDRGLVRFDGYNFKQFKDIHQDTITLSRYISAISINKKEIWIGSRTGTFFCYNTATRTLKKYAIGNKYAFAGKMIDRIYKDHCGNIWLAIHNWGVVMYTVTSGDYKPFFVPHAQNSQPGRNTYNAGGFIESGDSSLWITTGIGLFKCDKKSELLQLIHNPSCKTKSILKAYSALTGYNPVTKKNDDGAYSLDVLKYWRKKNIAGHKIFAFASLEDKHHLHVKQSVFLFGGCFIGLGLPLSSKKQHIWEVPPEGATGKGKRSSWGGHAVMIIGYNKKGLRVITWGKEKTMTWEFWETYCEESYAVFSDDFIKNEKTPAGVDIHTLRKDIAALKKKKK